MSYSPGLNAGLLSRIFGGPVPAASAPNPVERTAYTGTIDPGNGLTQGNQIGSMPAPRQSWGTSQLAGWNQGDNYAGYHPTGGPAAPPATGLPVASWAASNQHPTTTIGAIQNPVLPPSGVAPHPHDPAHPAEMGQWGGGGWNVGSGAPASMQPMWLGSFNNGATWSQQPGQNAGAPKPGTTNSGWGMAKNQDPDSPTWVQGGR